MNLDETRTRFLEYVREIFTEKGAYQIPEAHIYDDQGMLTACALIGLDKDEQREAINRAIVDMIVAKKSQPVLVLHAMEVFALRVRASVEEARSLDEALSGRIHQHPSRKEALVVGVEAVDGPTEMWWADIERDPAGKALLGEWRRQEFVTPYPGWRRYFPHAAYYSPKTKA